MNVKVRRLALFIFGISALFLVLSGSWSEGFLILLVATVFLIWFDKKHVEGRVSAILPKLYVCAKPDEYLEWLDELNQELLFQNIVQEKLDVYRTSGWLYQRGNANIDLAACSASLETGEAVKGLKVFLGQCLLSPADRHRILLNRLYAAWASQGPQLKNISPEAMRKKIEKSESLIRDEDPQKSILHLIGELLQAKWLLAYGHYGDAEQLLLELRETEVFNLMFGEVNFHLAQIEMEKKEFEKAAHYYRVALNFADGTALEDIIPNE